MLASCVAAGCVDDGFNAYDPGRGPGSTIGERDEMNTSFAGGVSPDTPPRAAVGSPDWQSCDAACRAHCDAQEFNNPIDEAICPHLWGVGLDTLPVNETQTCRRLVADTAGVFPSETEIADHCETLSTVDEYTLALVRSPSFVVQQQRRWADRLRYNNIAVNFERIYDADEIVARAYAGEISYDELVAVLSAHPVLTRRYDSAGDRAEALFTTFMGRPPFANERADMGKLYTLWANDYLDHPQLGIRLPDAYIEHACVDEDGEVDPETVGACTSILWGHNELVLTPSTRTVENLTWCEVLSPAEWEALQLPGRLLGLELELWEAAVSEVLSLYLGYDLADYTPAVVSALMEYVFEHGGDIRAAHYAVLTSQIYRQGTDCTDPACQATDLPWTFGPLKQADAELWVDTLGFRTQQDVGDCDHRLPEIAQFTDSYSPYAKGVLRGSRWPMDADDEVDTDYRDLVQSLGGCPDNAVSGRFKSISILNTATQEAFTAQLCNPALVPDAGVDVEILLPLEVAPSTGLDVAIAESIVQYQVRQFYGRPPTSGELAFAAQGAAECAPAPCNAEQFARPACYALLSSAEMLFY